MLELIKELSKLSGLISRLLIREKDPLTKKNLLNHLAMVNEKLEVASQNSDLKIGSDFFQSAIHNIKAADPLIKQIQEKDKPYPDLFDHVMNIVDELEKLFSRLGIEANPLNENQPPKSNNNKT